MWEGWLNDALDISIFSFNMEGTPAVTFRRMLEGIHLDVIKKTVTRVLGRGAFPQEVTKKKAYLVQACDELPDDNPLKIQLSIMYQRKVEASKQAAVTEERLRKERTAVQSDQRVFTYSARDFMVVPTEEEVKVLCF